MISLVFLLRRQVSKAQFLPGLFGHQAFVHPAAEVVFGLLATLGRFELGVVQADHVLGVELFALSLMVQREAALLWWRGLELLCAEHVSSHHLLRFAGKSSGFFVNSAMPEMDIK